MEQSLGSKRRVGHTGGKECKDEGWGPGSGRNRKCMSRMVKGYKKVPSSKETSIDRFESESTRVVDCHPRPETCGRCEGFEDR